MIGLTNLILITAGRDAVLLLVWSCQATVLLALVWLLMKVRPASPILRHRIWLLGLTAVAVLPLLATLTQRFPSLRPPGVIVNYAIELPRVIPDAAPPLTATLTANESITSAPSWPFRFCSMWPLVSTSPILRAARFPTGPPRLPSCLRPFAPFLPSIPPPHWPKRWKFSLPPWQ